MKWSFARHRNDGNALFITTCLRLHWPRNHLASSQARRIRSTKTEQVHFVRNMTSKRMSNSANGQDAAEDDDPVVAGNATNFWLLTQQHGWDLTHPEDLKSPRPDTKLRLETTTAPVTIDPAKTALVIVDMQNFFLSAARGRSKGPGHRAEEALLNKAISAARKANIQVVWITWGITQEELGVLPLLSPVSSVSTWRKNKRTRRQRSVRAKAALELDNQSAMSCWPTGPLSPLAAC